MMPDGSYFQEEAETKGHIAEEIIGTLKKPYFYAVFMLQGDNRAFSELNEQELTNTYRYHALRKIVMRISEK